MTTLKRSAWDTLANTFLFAYIFYGKCLIYLGYQQGRLSLVLLFATLVFCFLADGMRIKICKCMVYELVFIAITMFTSIAIAKDLSISLEVLETQIDAFLLGYIIIRTSLRAGKVDTVLYAWVASALVFSISIITTGGTVLAGGRITISEDLNVNTLGIFLTFAIWAVLYFISKKKTTVVKAMTAVALIAVFLYVIVLTASKKSIGISMILISGWILWCLFPMLKKMSLSRRLLVICSFIFAVFFIIREFSSAFSEANVLLFNRLDNLANSAELRIGLIKDALVVFFHNPVIGVGWNNYKLYSLYGMYSHCTYVELLVCTGVLGAFFGTAMLVVSLKGLLYGIKGGKKASNIDLTHVWMVILLCTLLINAITQILFYNANLLILMHLLFAYSEIRLREFKKELV